MVDQTAFTAVDLSRLPAPAVIETLSYEAILADTLATLRMLMPDFDAIVESDPAVKLLQVGAYREMLLRARYNDAARAVMPAYAIGPDLDNLAALMGVARLLLAPAAPERGIDAVYETDIDLRRRLVLAPEGYSVAGPEGAYIYHALTGAPAVLDASATSPSPGEVLVTILARAGNGRATPALIAQVADYVSAETRRPMTDHVTVQSAAIVDYRITAAIRTFSGPDPAIVLAEANRRLAVHVADTHRIGRDVTRSGIFAALHIDGVQNVVLSEPAADLVLDRTQAPYCTAIAVTHAGAGE